MSTKQQMIASLDSFTSAYIECALWSSIDNSDDSGGDPLDSNYGVDDLSLSCLRECIADCAAFQADNAELLAESGQGDDQSGHDFWLTRNGHGAGFWDRGLGEIGEKLSDAARVYGSVDLYVHRKRIYA